MSVLKKLIIISLILFISCGENQKKEDTSDNITPLIDGFWERKGTVQFVDGKPVDTLFYGIDEEGMKNIKAYSNDNVFWINNFSDKNNPWPGGMGGYGKFEINTLDFLKNNKTYVFIAAKHIYILKYFSLCAFKMIFVFACDIHSGQISS